MTNGVSTMNKIFPIFLCIIFSSCVSAVSTPDYGDTYVDTLLGDASYLNPLLATDSASGSINNLIYNGLVKYDKNIKLVPELARSWSVSKDGLTIIFKLRKNVYWHDGIPFTADDVKFTYDRLIDPKVKTPYSSDYMLVKQVVAVDKYTVKVVYKEPFAPALESWGMGMVPKHIYEKGDFNTNPANRQPVGTGPFKFTQWKTDEKLVLSANDKYYEGKPYLNKVIFRVIPDQSVQFLELRNQSIDSMGLSPDQYKAYPEFFEHYTKFRYPSFQYTYFGFNLQRPLFKDKRVRLAIAHAINKKELIDGVLLGMGQPATGPFVPQSWAYNPDIKDYEYDPAKAKQLLAQAGVKSFEFTILTNQGNKLRELACQIIQNQLAKAGIKVNIRISEWSAFIHNFVDKRNFDVVVLGWSLSRDPDQYAIWHSGQIKEGQYNFVSYNSPIVDKLLEKGRREFNQHERQKIYRQIHKQIFDDIPYIFLYYPESLPVIHTRFQGPEVAPLGLGWNFYQWYVPAAMQKYKIN
jgi:peptide/nickel transport system substrate-binding protein